MRKMTNYILFTACLATVFLATWGNAQQRTTAASVSVPFDFWIGNKKFPAGDYTLDSSIPTFISIRSKMGSINEQVPTILYGDAVDKKDARLVFVSRNGRYYLMELWGVLGKRTVTSEYGKNLQQDGRREVSLKYP